MIHQIFLSDNPIPEQMAAFHEGIKNLHGAENVKLWRDDECATLAEEFGLKKLFNGFPHWVYKSDIARVLIIYKYGGWYLDMDIELLQPLPEPERFTIIAGQNYPIENAAFYAPANHPILKKYLYNLRFLKQMKGNPMHTLGRRALYRCFGLAPVKIMQLDEFGKYGTHHYMETWVESLQDVLNGHYIGL